MATKKRSAYDDFGSIFGSVAQGVKSQRPKNKLYMLTPPGRQKIANYELEGQRFEVMSTIKQKEPCTAREIAEFHNMSIDKAKHILDDLIQDQYVMTREG